jgi:Zn-dependent peptidase ImmA (M78 family)
MKSTRRPIDAKIEELLARSKIMSPPVDVDAIAKRLGVPIYTRPLPKDISGFLHRNESAALIAVNSKQAKTRQRFTIAHELGHLILNHKPNQVHVDRNYDILFRANAVSADPEETQANFFAAALLMPYEFLKQDLQPFQNNGSFEDSVLEQLRERYGVSMQALIIRLNSLGYAPTLSV